MEVAKGNYDIRLNEDSKIYEVQNMANSFNIMAKELASTEIIHSDFIQNISHEIKTPLSSIEGYATLLQSKNLSEEKRQLYVSKIINSTKRLSNLTSNILELTKLENQETDLITNNFSLSEQIREVILLYEEVWTKKNIDFDIELDELQFNGNEQLLFQVWHNIINNAIKFSKDNDVIEIKSKVCDGKIVISIKDNGIGMNEEVKHRIFEKFYQGDTSHAISGNGLGLALAKKIIELHNGNILVESEVGDGSCFYVELPY